MKVLNLMWGFNSCGVGKCFLAYAELGDVNPELEIRSVVINIANVPSDLEPARKAGVSFLDIRNRFDFSWIAKLGQVIDSFQPDAVFTHAFNGPVVAMIARIFCRHKFILLCSYHGEYHAPTVSRKLVEPLFNGMMHWIYRHHAAGVTTVCDFCKESLIKRYCVPEHKITIVRNGIRDICADYCPPKFPKSYDEEHPFTIGTLSRLDSVKGVRFVIQALPQLSDIPLRLIIVGDGPEREALESLAAKLHMDTRVMFAGFQNNTRAWLEQFDVFLMPSLFEYHSLSLLEAMCCGRPIIATSVGGNAESVRDSREAVLIPAGDTKAIATAIRFLYGNADACSKFGQNARDRYLQEFTRNRMKHELADWLLSFSGFC